MSEFQRDFARICAISVDGPVKTLTYKRLRMLHNRFKLHKLLNERREAVESEDDPRDFSNVVKVDTHIHLSAAMTGKHLFDFIKRKAKTESNVLLAFCTSLGASELLTPPSLLGRCE